MSANQCQRGLTVLEKGGFNLSSGQTVTRHVHNIVDTATDPVVAIVIATSAITSELQKVSRNSLGC